MVTLRDNGEKLVCKDPSRLVNRLVFCHRVIVEDVITLVIRCKFGNQAAKAITINVTDMDSTRYLGLVIIRAIVAMTDLLEHRINDRLESRKRLGADYQVSVYFPITSCFTNHKCWRAGGACRSAVGDVLLNFISLCLS